MPESSAMEVKWLRVSRRLIVGAIVGAASLVLALVASIIVSVYMTGHSGENNALRDENTALLTRIEKLDDRLREVDQMVGQVKAFDTKLRSITNISDPSRDLAIGPVGTAAVVEDTSDETSAALRRDLMGGDGSRSLALVEQRTGMAEKDAAQTQRSVERLSVFLNGQSAMLASTPSRRPTRGYVSSRYGMRIDPFTGLPQLHAGIDFSSRMGAKVSSSADGKVLFAGKKGAYGKTVEVGHGNGLVTKYAHMSKIHVKVGQKVRRGQPVGAVGNSGRSTGPHLHYEIRLNGIPQNPQRFLLE